jgi:hypothetical protein
MIQTTELRLACRDLWIWGSASTTIVVSTAVMRTPVAITASAHEGDPPRAELSLWGTSSA